MVKNRLFRNRVAVGLLLALGLLAGAAVARAADAPAPHAPSAGGNGAGEAPLTVHILLDNSGSMYPGYGPPGYPGTKKSQSGAKFYYEYPEFRKWLGDFVARQEILGAKTVSVSAFTTTGAFHPGDIREIHPPTPLAKFDPERLVEPLRELGYGRDTFLRESLESFSRGIDGLVWLITDNIVETRRGTPDEDVKEFFEGLMNGKAYQSVHLFKYPFRDPVANQSSALAVYGIRVAPRPLSKEALTDFDMKMRSEFLLASRRTGSPPGDLFPGHEHLKFRELAIDALELLKLSFDSRPAAVEEENRKVSLELHGEIHSYLTQHWVTHGNYTLTPSSPFVPEDWAARDLGVSPLPSQAFVPVTTPLPSKIPPNSVQSIVESIPSRGDVRITTHGLWAWLHAALFGAIVEYTGTAEVAFTDVQIELERARMAGIFGIDKLPPSLSKFQDVKEITVQPTSVPIHLALRTSSRRGFLLALLLLVLGLPFAAAIWLLTRTESYRIKIADQNPVVPLRRLGRHDVYFKGHRLGTLSRSLGGGPVFSPQQESVAVTVEPGRSAGVYDVRLRDVGSYQLVIEPLSGAAVTPGGGPGGRPAGLGGPVLRPPDPTPPSAGGPGPGAAPPRGGPSAPPPGAGPKIRLP